MPLNAPGPELIPETSPNVRVAGAAVVRRRGTLQQGQALELLGHAVEYLVDSRVFATEASSVRENQEAVQLLKRLSRDVFAECAEIKSVRRRIERWLGRLAWEQGAVGKPRGR